MGDGTMLWTVPEDEIADNLALRAGIYPVFNVKDPAYGATGNGTTDDRAAIQVAVDACEAAGGGIVFFPAGTFAVSNTVTVDSPHVVLMGIGLERSLIKFTSTSTATGPVLLFTNASFLLGCGLSEIGIHGNKGSVTTSEGCVKCINTRRFRADNVWVTESSGYGIHTNTTSTGSVTDTQDNFYTRIYSSANNKSGQHYQSEKNSQWVLLRSNDDCLSGIDGDGGLVWEAGATTTIRETTENTIGNILVSDSGRFSLIFDGITKYAVANVQIHSGEDSAVFFRCTNTDGSTNGGIINTCTFSNFSIRNAARSATFLGWAGIETDSVNTSVTGNNFSNWLVTGANQATAGPGAFDIRGWQHSTFVGVHESSTKGVAWHIREGQNTSGAAQGAQLLTWVGCSLQNHGLSSTGSVNHGFFLEEGATSATAGIQILGGRLLSSLTDGVTSWEVYVEAGVLRVQLSDLYIDAATNGGELKIEAGAEDEVRVDNCTFRGSSVFSPTVASAAALTLPHEAMDRICEVSGTTGITSITAWPDGAKVSLRFTAGAAWPTVTDGSNLKLNGNFTSVSNDGLLTLICDGTNWYEIGRFTG
jgi:hypothetical protein